MSGSVHEGLTDMLCFLYNTLALGDVMTPRSRHLLDSVIPKSYSHLIDTPHDGVVFVFTLGIYVTDGVPHVRIDDVIRGNITLSSEFEWRREALVVHEACLPRTSIYALHAMYYLIQDMPLVDRPMTGHYRRHRLIREWNVTLNKALTNIHDNSRTWRLSAGYAHERDLFGLNETTERGVTSTPSSGISSGGVRIRDLRWRSSSGHVPRGSSRRSSPTPPYIRKT
jgi:hypothetical protein